MTLHTPPVLLLVFNRPDKTKLVFDRIRSARPSRLYIAADGPRADHPTDAEACAQTRAIADAVDWPCKVQTLFREDNLGCRYAVAGALDWFFEHEPEGIIIEDDILLDLSFFRFAAEMLEHYRDDPKVMMVSACNLVFGLGDTTPHTGDDSYTFSHYSQIWGWACWRETWEKYDHTLDDLDSAQSIATLMSSEIKGLDMVRHWMWKFRKVRAGKIDTWDYSLLYSQWLHGGLCVIPRVNLMQNIGFDGTATHTTDPDHAHSKIKADSLSQPLQHPAQVTRNDAYDTILSRRFYHVPDLTFSRRVTRWFKGV